MLKRKTEVKIVISDLENIGNEYHDDILRQEHLGPFRLRHEGLNGRNWTFWTNCQLISAMNFTPNDLRSQSV